MEDAGLLDQTPAEYAVDRQRRVRGIDCDARIGRRVKERDEAEVDPRLELARELDRVRRVVDGEMLDAHERVRQDPL